MPGPDIVPIRSLEEGQFAFEQHVKEIDAVREDQLSPQNVDMMSATSVVIGVAPTIATFRDQIVRLYDTDVRCVDHLGAYAKATLFLFVTNFAPAEPPRDLEERVAPLRAKLLLWAIPLAQSGIISQASVDKIREGSGLKDGAADLIAMATLYRGCWEQVRTMCGVTEEDLDNASRIGLAVYAAASLRENAPASVPVTTLRLRKSWTLLDRAYTECRRALGYIRYAQGDADTIAPSLRRNPGVRRTPEAQNPAPAETPAPTPITSPAPIMAGAPVGGGASPFINR